jgi:hypothetical protein
MSRVFLSLILFLGFTANAGLFSSGEPPKDFMALKVSAISSNRKEVTFTIDEFAKLLNDPSNGNTISWDKTSDTFWILKVKHKDKMTGQTSRLGWEFAKEGAKAVVKRMSADDAVLSSDIEILNGMQPYASIIEQLHAKKK